jgi:MFS family permease
VLLTGRRLGAVGAGLTGRRLFGAVGALSLDQLVAWGVLYYAYAVLSAPIAADLGVSRTAVAAAFSGCLLIAGWTARAIGPVLDERGTATLMRAGAVAGPFAFAALAAVGGLGGLVLVFAALGAVHAVALYEPAFRTLVDWCPVERQRARMTLLLTSVGGLASTVFLPLTGWLVERHGWRPAVALLSALLALVLIPVRFAVPLPRRHNAAAAPRIRLAEAPRSATLLSIGLSLHALASTGAFISLLWFLVERGETAAAAAAIAGLAGAAQVPGRLVGGLLRRALGDRSILAVLLAAQAAGLLGAVVLGGPASIALIMLFGAASGMMTLERTTVLVDWYGRARFGAHQGRLSAATSTARAAAPFLVEAAHHLLSYRAAFAGLAAVLACAAWACAAAARAQRDETLTAQVAQAPAS